MGLTERVGGPNPRVPDGLAREFLTLEGVEMGPMPWYRQAGQMSRNGCVISICVWLLFCPGNGHTGIFHVAPRMDLEVEDNVGLLMEVDIVSRKEAVQPFEDFSAVSRAKSPKRNTSSLPKSSIILFMLSFLTALVRCISVIIQLTHLAYTVHRHMQPSLQSILEHFCHLRKKSHIL